MSVETIIAVLITAGFAFLGVYVSNRKQTALVAYRLEKLEKILEMSLRNPDEETRFYLMVSAMLLEGAVTPGGKHM